MATHINKNPAAPKSVSLKKAHTVLSYAHESARSMLKTFDDSRTARRATGGATTDEEQDMLRAMLVFASAGLDSSLKYLIKENVPALLYKQGDPRKKWEEFTRRRLRSDDGGDPSKVLAAVLTSDSPRDALVDMYVESLTGESLQSVEQLATVCDALGIPPGSGGANVVGLREVFRVRNDIIHELDIDFDDPARNRRVRKRDEMVSMANSALSVAQHVLNAVDSKL